MLVNVSNASYRGEQLHFILLIWDGASKSYLGCERNVKRTVGAKKSLNNKKKLVVAYQVHSSVVKTNAQKPRTPF